MPVQCRIQYVSDKRGLAGAGDSRHYGQGPEREADIYILEVVLHGSLDRYRIGPGADAAGIAGAAAGQILQRQGLRMCRRVRTVCETALEHHLAALATGKGAHIYQQVGGAHYLLVVLYHYDGISYVAQTPQYGDQPFGIARMQSDARLVEYVHRTHEARAERRHEADPLALSSRKRVACTVERKIRKPHILHAAQPRDDFRQGLVHDAPLGGSQGEAREVVQCLVHIH